MVASPWYGTRTSGVNEERSQDPAPDVRGDWPPFRLDG